MKLKIIPVLMLAVITSGCFSSQSVIKKYYTLEHEMDNKNSRLADDPIINGYCELVPVEISSLYETNQIINRSDSHEITLYKYHHWAVRPSIAIKEFVYQYLEANNLFLGIATRFSKRIPEYSFQTIIKKLEVLEDADTFSAHLQIEFRILSEEGEVLLQHAAKRTEPLSEKDLNLFAKTISSMIHDELNTLISKAKEKEFHTVKNEYDAVMMDN